MLKALGIRELTHRKDTGISVYNSDYQRNRLIFHDSEEEKRQDYHVQGSERKLNGKPGRRDEDGV